MSKRKRWNVLNPKPFGRPSAELDREAMLLASYVGLPVPGATNILSEETYARYSAGMADLIAGRQRRRRKLSETATGRVAWHYRGWMNAMQSAGGWELLTTTRASRAKRARHAARPNGRRNK